MADFKPSKMPDEIFGNVLVASGEHYVKRMLGDAGATDVGKSSWVRCDLSMKTFFLYPLTCLQATDIGVPTVEIHGAMEMPAANEDDAAYELLGTLDTDNRALIIDRALWRFFRVVVTAAPDVAIQVTLNGLASF